MTEKEKIVSTGRGGAGNIGFEQKPKLDPNAVSQGHSGAHPGEHYSSGRGGAGNMMTTTEADKKTVKAPPESHTPGYTSTFGGRGGEGNIHQKKVEAHQKEGSS